MCIGLLIVLLIVVARDGETSVVAKQVLPEGNRHLFVGERDFEAVVTDAVLGRHRLKCGAVSVSEVGNELFHGPVDLFTGGVAELQPVAGKQAGAHEGFLDILMDEGEDFVPVLFIQLIGELCLVAGEPVAIDILGQAHAFVFHDCRTAVGAGASDCCKEQCEQKQNRKDAEEYLFHEWGTSSGCAGAASWLGAASAIS